MDEENDYIRISVYGKGSKFLSVKEVRKEVIADTFGHGGGDSMMVNDFYYALSGDEKLGTTLERSVESHLMALAAEQSRLTGKVIKVHEKV
jgi:hypothetical protein